MTTGNTRCGIHKTTSNSVEYTYRTAPYKHQRKSLRWLTKQVDCGALLMEPGLGKTKVVIDYLGVRYLKNGPEKWLVVAPKISLRTWQREFETHCAISDIPAPDVLHGSILERATQLHEASAPCVMLTNHETFSSRRKVKGTKSVTEGDRLLQAIKHAGFTGLIIDESHRIKGRTAKRTQLLARVAANVNFVLLMTGTVAPNNPTDVWAQWNVMNPERFGSWSDFSNTYITWGGFQNRQMVAFKHLDELNQLIQLDSYIAKKVDCMDLPPVIHKIIDIELEEPEAQAYAKMAQEFCFQDDRGNWHLADNGLVRMLRLRQITSGYLEELELGASKLHACQELVEDLADAKEKIVIFAHFRKDIERLRRGLSDYSPYVIHGSVTADKRQEQLDEFVTKPGPLVLIGQVRSMGISINELVVSSSAIFFSLSERRDDWIQAKDRLDRNGQTRPVTCYYLLAPRTIDEAMWKAYNEKQRLEEVLLQSPSTYLGQ